MNMDNKLEEILEGNIHDMGCFEYSTGNVTQEIVDQNTKEIISEIKKLMNEAIEEAKPEKYKKVDSIVHPHAFYNLGIDMFEENLKKEVEG